MNGCGRLAIAVKDLQQGDAIQQLGLAIAHVADILEDFPDTMAPP